MHEKSIFIEPFKPEYREHFARLNLEWLEKFFHVEPHDADVLSRPEEEILIPGGEIFFANLDKAIVGTCALAKVNADTFELAKMAVTESAQGLGIGRMLALAVIEKARNRGAKLIFLESNSKLAPALSLYRSVGFVDAIRPFQTTYHRSDVYMELKL